MSGKRPANLCRGSEPNVVSEAGIDANWEDEGQSASDYWIKHVNQGRAQVKAIQHGYHSRQQEYTTNIESQTGSDILCSWSLMQLILRGTSDLVSPLATGIALSDVM
jgi:hypothetical protein